MQGLRKEEGQGRYVVEVFHRTANPGESSNSQEGEGNIPSNNSRFLGRLIGS